MKRIINRKALIKLLGKEVRYNAKFQCTTKGSTSVMLVDVEYNGKIVADHIWIGAGIELSHCKAGDKLSFLGTANSYKDIHGIRKYGLRKCYHFHFTEYSSLEEVRKDNTQKNKRLYK